MLVAEVFEQEERWNDAIKWSQAELNCDWNLCALSKCRAGRVLMRAHAALGEHSLSCAAFDSGLQLAQDGKYLLEVRSGAERTPWWFLTCTLLVLL